MATLATPLTPTNTSVDATTVYATEFDGGRYTSFPLTTSTTLVALVKDLEADAPEDLTPSEAERRDRMTADRSHLQDVMGDDLKAVDDTDRRPTFYDLSNAWRVLHTRNAATTELRMDVPERAHAKTCQTILFPDGVEFVAQTSKAVLVDSEIRIKLVDGDPAIRASLIAANGEWSYNAVKAAHVAHEAYCADAAASAKLPAGTADVTRAVTELRVSVLEYMRQIVSNVSERRPASVLRATAALAAIEALREGRRKSAGPKAAEKDGEAPAAVATEATLAAANHD